jgi:hypothetical protein
MPDILDPEPAPMLEQIVPPEVRYDEAVASQNPAAVDQAWAALAASGVRPTTARVYPPTDPTGGRSTHESVQWIGAQVDPSTVNEVAEMAQQYNIPMAAAAAAIDSQLRFQAQRGYQKDLEAGMEATEAMAKWGPALFSTGARGRYGGMVQLPQRKFMNVGGRAYFVDPLTGTAKPVTPEVTPIQKQVQTPDAVKADYLHLLQLDSLYARGITTGSMDTTEATRQRRMIQDNLRSMREQYRFLTQPTSTTGAPMGVTAPVSPGAPTTATAPAAGRTITAEQRQKARELRAAGKLQIMKSQAEVDALPSGTPFIHVDGRTMIKP